MSIRHRIAAAFGGVFLIVAGMAAYLVAAALGDLAEDQRVADRVRLAPTISALVHELQKERGMSAGYLSSGGVRFASELIEQRGLTDAARTTYEGILPKLSLERDFAEEVAAIEKALDGLARVREQISAQSIKGPDMSGFYSPLISELLDIAGGVAHGVRDGEIVRDAGVYSSILQAKERAGLERAAGATGFSAEHFDAQTYDRFVALGAAQAAFIANAKLAATPAFRDEIDKTIVGPAVDEVVRLREAGRMRAFGGENRNISGAAWFDAATARIELFKALEDKASAVVARSARSATENAIRHVIFWGAVAIVSLALFAGIVWWMNASLANPLMRLVDKVRRVSSGDLSVDIPEAKRTDEIGRMGEALEVFKANAMEREQLQAREQIEIKARDERRVRIEGLIDGFRIQARTALEGLDSLAGRMTEAGSSIATASNSASHGALAADQASGEAASAVHTVAAAVEQLTASIREISDRVCDNQESVAIASNDANDTKAAVSSLEEAAKSISSVVTFIAEIAAQTNLLALNATIEAARAGEAGKGFAVVASEVKGLAEQTAKATSEISKQVQNIQSRVDQSAVSIETIANRLSRLLDTSSAIASAVEQQSAATQSISQSVHDAARGSAQSSDSVRMLSGAVAQTESDAQLVRASATQLSHAARNLDQVVTTFLAAVAA